MAVQIMYQLSQRSSATDIIIILSVNIYLKRILELVQLEVGHFGDWRIYMSLYSQYSIAD